jgi:hypothetical protein
LDEADAFCRKCGKPVGDAGNKPEPSPVSVQNPYRGKNKQIIGAIVIVLGVILMLLAYEEGSTTFSVLGTLMGIAGVIIVAVGKGQHWYHAE